MAKLSREKGKRFERLIASELRSRWPDAVIRRASQAERADNPDVFCEGGPPILARLWLELQDSRTPTPLGKLQQAEHDTLAWHAKRPTIPTLRLPVVIWHRIREVKTYATLRLATLDAICGALHVVRDQVVQLELGDLLDLVATHNQQPKLSDERQPELFS